MWPGRIEGSVSYTHLDVYKRQPLEGMENHADFLQDVAVDNGNIVLRKGKGAGPGQEFGCERVYVPDEIEAAALGRSVFRCLGAVMVEAVSYTHLDVYKRQFQTFGDGTLWQAISTVIKSSEFFRMTFFSP